MMKLISNSREEAFVLACWAFKLRKRIEEPTAHEFGLPWHQAEMLARVVQREFEERVLAIARGLAA
jgi:hypothetical protein